MTVTARQLATEQLWRTVEEARHGSMRARFALLQTSLSTGEPKLAKRATSLLASMMPVREAVFGAEVIPLPMHRVWAPSDTEPAA